MQEVRSGRTEPSGGAVPGGLSQGLAPVRAGGREPVSGSRQCVGGGDEPGSGSRPRAVPGGREPVSGSRQGGGGRSRAWVRLPSPRPGWVVHGVHSCRVVPGWRAGQPVVSLCQAPELPWGPAAAFKEKTRVPWQREKEGCGCRTSEVGGARPPGTLCRDGARSARADIWGLGAPPGWEGWRARTGPTVVVCLHVHICQFSLEASGQRSGYTPLPCESR